ncbi:MAG: hypothetical protein QNJ37_15595 [Crocosphaera sp.]|nr:hypothetical protein [Crocosphaera sp.]
MLSTDIQREFIIQRIEKVVSSLMEERPLFKEDLDYREIVKHLLNIAQKNLAYQQFHDISDKELKEICSFIMATEVLAKIGEDLTPEQMLIFDEAIQRK